MSVDSKKAIAGAAAELANLAVENEEELSAQKRKEAAKTFMRIFEEKHSLGGKLLENIKDNLPKLKKLLKKMDSEWGYEDEVYRFYHGSFKAYRIQNETVDIVEWINYLNPDPATVKLNESFLEIIKDGTGKVFEMEHNHDWDKITRPMFEAFFHAHYMLKMMVRYGKELKEALQCLPSGWAAVLYLYNLR